MYFLTLFLKPFPWFQIPAPFEHIAALLCLSQDGFRGLIQRKTWCMGSYAGVDYNSTYGHSRVVSNTFTMGNPMSVSTSNGKSSIVEERLYLFFFAFFPKKKRSFVFSFFLFYTITKEDICFASIL